MTHAEFIHRTDSEGIASPWISKSGRSPDSASGSSQFYFLEVAARVGGAYTTDTIAAATGVNPWREWAKIELATPERPYILSPVRQEYGGIALSLARQEYPSTSSYTDPEIVYRVNKPWHVGLIVRSPDYDRVIELLTQYTRRFSEEFTAVAPPEEKPEIRL